ncbi:hypothetical protein DI272_35095 [Streptomyces sp. Act143]|uniref:ATP-binding protein n=1 Tax=Streptomyces sp. Act143 TaxID=2200760 RepID=UPI000D6807D1|nr:AAA family ATPase [Streptomyces sp. Act143]PWI18787.1 hypothetical protein DI272_35095 [Streptomyces sp. Act143]
MGNPSVARARLVGRRDEIAEVHRLLFERSRLVTLTGVGGVGKTRVAWAVARTAHTRFRDGVWFVELSSLSEESLVPHVIAEALQLADQTTRPVIDAVAEYLADREALLVLDTCEHLVDGCALTAEALLRAAPGLRVLTTSRRPLGMMAEEVLRVDPLPVPEGRRSTTDAMVLFTERAREAVPDFRVTDANRADVVQLCRRLEGLPLALELAAARLRELPLTELAERLDDRFALLGDTEKAVPDADPPWHQALRTAIGWSHELCTPAERLLWARLSVFAGGFEAEAVLHVCADERLAADSVVELLAALVDKSILTWQPDQHAERFRMLDTVREYGGHWLRELGEQDLLRRRHRDYCLALVREGCAAWIGPHQHTWQRRMTDQVDNLRAALEYSLRHPEGHAALELAGGLWFFWHCLGFHHEGHHYLERALACDPTPGRERGQALWASSLVLSSLGDPDAGEARATECAGLAERLDDAELRDHARAMLAFAAILRGDSARAVPLAQELLDKHDCAGALGHPWMAAGLFRGQAHLLEGRVEDALVVLEHLHSDCARHGERWMRGYADYMLARAESARGRHEAARRHGRAALRAKQQLNDRLGMAMALDVLTVAAAGEGRGAQTAYLLGLTHRLWATVGQSQVGVAAWITARERCEKQAREAMGDASYEEAFRAGCETDLATAVDEQLGLSA